MMTGREKESIGYNISLFDQSISNASFNSLHRHP
jgi:hypothetical protein